MAQLGHQPHWLKRMVRRTTCDKGSAHENNIVRVGKSIGNRRRIKCALSVKNLSYRVIEFFELSFPVRTNLSHTLLIRTSTL